MLYLKTGSLGTDCNDFSHQLALIDNADEIVSVSGSKASIGANLGESGFNTIDNLTIQIHCVLLLLYVAK